MFIKWSSLQKCLSKFIPKKFYEIGPLRPTGIEFSFPYISEANSTSLAISPAKLSFKKFYDIKKIKILNKFLQYETKLGAIKTDNGSFLSLK